MPWQTTSTDFNLAIGDATINVTPAPLAIELRDAAGEVLTRTASGSAYPGAPVAARIGGEWRAPNGAPEASVREDRLVLTWGEPPLTLTLALGDDGSLELDLHAPGAEAVALALVSAADEHYFGLGERFNKLDQRGEVVELWVKNGASGGNTYKPVPFVASSRGYGLALDTSHRAFCALAHPTVPDAATFTVEADRLRAALLPGGTPAAVLARYTRRVGRPPIPPAWVFQPWKSRDWRQETQETVLEDVRRQGELGIPCGVKLIDATWESESHSFRFDPAKYPDPEGMIREVRAAGMEIVLWLSPSMTAGTSEYEECAAKGYLIKDRADRPYLHPLGNQPGWEGTTIDFSHPPAVAWWQQKLRALLEMGVRGFKTDFGEQVPADALFANGKSGAEMHNLLPVHYNRASWEVVRGYGGILLARAAWAGSQPYPAIWAGDQSADFSPWAGLPTAIVAGQSAGWSGFPYWGSDVGGYFNAPDDEVFVRWAEFAALTPIMEAHGLGPREPWLFAPSTLETYRRYAHLHASLVPYSLAAALEATRTGLPLMRAMPLVYPDQPDAYQEWVQYQYLYGPDLLVAPVYSWGTSRLVWFPPGEWVDFFSGEHHVGPKTERVPAPLATLPLFVRAGAVLPLQPEGSDELLLQLDPGGSSATELPDGTRLAFEATSPAGGTLTVSGPPRRYRLRAPHAPLARTSRDGRELDITDGGVAWEGDAILTIECERPR